MALAAYGFVQTIIAAFFTKAPAAIVVPILTLASFTSIALKAMGLTAIYCHL